MVSLSNPPSAYSSLKSTDSDEPEWIIEQAKARKRREMLRQREDMEARLAKIRAKEKAQRDRYMKGDPNFKKRKTNVESSEKDDDEEQFVLDDYDSDEEQRSSKDKGSLYSAKTLELMEKLGMGASMLKEEEDEVEEETKVRCYVLIFDLLSPFADLLLFSNTLPTRPVH
jgi:chromosome transmission fidelity protein 1